jgi:hypothetical protein
MQAEAAKRPARDHQQRRVRPDSAKAKAADAAAGV